MSLGDTKLTCSVIVVEDEPLIAADIEFAAEDAGCEVLGIARTIDEAFELLEAKACQGAILDANLNGESARPVMDYLEEKAVPYIIVSGYLRSQLDLVKEETVMIGKPFSLSELTDTIRQEIYQKSKCANPDQSEAAE